MQLTFPCFDKRELELLEECLGSRWVTQGPFVLRLEEEVARRQGAKHALAVTSCTAALHIAVLALGLGPGDEVVVPAFTWVTSASCAEYAGARAVFADVDPDTFTLDPDALEAAISPRTRAIVPVHLFGLPARMDEILSIAARYNLAVIEDAACAIGTTYNGRPVGGIGDIGCFSFHPRKVVTTGEGGMITTNRDDLRDRCFSLRCHGSTGFPPGTTLPAMPYVMDSFEYLGYNYRLSDIQAAVGVAQIEKLDMLLEERRMLALRYHELLADCEQFVLPICPSYGAHTYQSYVVRLRFGGMTARNRIMEVLFSAGIQTRPGTHAVHRLGYYARKYGLKAEDYPMAALCEDTSITLPLFPGMTSDDQIRITDLLKASAAC